MRYDKDVETIALLRAALEKFADRTNWYDDGCTAPEWHGATVKIISPWEEARAALQTCERP